jgi:hypothetical protein
MHLGSASPQKKFIPKESDSNIEDLKVIIVGSPFQKDLRSDDFDGSSDSKTKLLKKLPPKEESLSIARISMTHELSLEGYTKLRQGEGLFSSESSVLPLALFKDKE